MTIWSAPDVTYLLDEHLTRARNELLADGRLKVKAEGVDGEDPGFVAELIVDKLEAAAQAGFDAIEASLRASASEFLAGKGLDVAKVRATLGTANARLVPPRRPHLEKVELGAIPSAVVGGMIAAAGIVAAFTLWVFGVINLGAYVVVNIAGLAAGYSLYHWIRLRAARLRATLIDEWPARVCRHYNSTVNEGTAYYEHVVRTAARGGMLIPWR